jgi:RNA polymerase sigma-70 factor (ECF subfamily)
MYSRYYREMVERAVAFLHDRASAEEVVQDTWAAIIEGIDGFKGNGSFKSWAFKILTNKAKRRFWRESRFSAIKSFFRSQSGSDDHVPFDHSGSWVRPPARWQVAPEEMLISDEFRQEMKQFVASLPSRQRKVFVLRDIEGWSSERVCESLGISAGNQRILLHRARAAIYRWYTSRGRRRP